MGNSCFRSTEAQLELRQTRDAKALPEALSLSGNLRTPQSEDSLLLPAEPHATALVHVEKFPPCAVTPSQCKDVACLHHQQHTLVK